MAGMGHMKDLLATVYGGGDDAVEAAVALAGLQKHMQAQVAIDNATGDITDIVTVLRGAGFAALSPSADSSASLLHYCVNHAADEIERLRDERRWIAVSERLPEDRQRVIACFPPVRSGDPTDVCEATFNKAQGWFAMEHGCYTATHWMPLPEPPAKCP
jgi:hypothetical protein